MSQNNDVEEMLVVDVKPILEAAHNAISEMADGQRVQIKDLAQTVGLAVSKSPKEVLGFVNYFAHKTKIAYVTRGKNGGVIKGTKPVKTDKVKKAKKVATVAPASSDSNSTV